MRRTALPLIGAGIALVATGPALAADILVEEFGEMTRITVPGSVQTGWTVRNGAQSIDLRKFGTDLDIASPVLSDNSRLETFGLWKGKTNSGISIRFSCDCTSSHAFNSDGSVVVDVVGRAQPGVIETEPLATIAKPAPAREKRAIAEAGKPALREPPARGSGSIETATPSAILADEVRAAVRENALNRQDPRLAGPGKAATRALIAGTPAEDAPADEASAPEHRASAPVDEPKPAKTPVPRLRPVAAKAVTIRKASAPKRQASPAPPRQPVVRIDTPTATPLPRRKPRIDVAKSNDDAAIDALRETILKKLAIGVEQGKIVMDSGEPRTRDAYVPAGCPDEAALDLKRLTDTSDFRTALPGLRVAIYDDMKQLNPGAVRNLARHFIAFGLGEEARSVIEAFETEGPVEQLILTMAQVLEGLSDEVTEKLLVKADCGPRAATWRAMVAAENKDGNVREIYEDARNAIFDLPDPLRKILGARIAVALIDEGDRETAMRIWRNLEVSSGPETPEMALLQVYAVEGSPLHRLIDLSTTRSPIAVEAALRAAAILETTQERRSAERLDVALGDLSFIYRDSPDETPLSLAHARLQARYGKLASALTALAEKAEEHPEDAGHWRDIAHDTIRVATEGADPVARPHDFDTILTSLQYLDDSPGSDQAKFSLVRKLMAVGGAHIVESVLTPKILRRSDEATRLLAEARLLTGDAGGARALLSSLKDEESAPLRQRVETVVGNESANSARALFGPVKRTPEKASISAARDLLDEADADLSIIEELLADG